MIYYFIPDSKLGDGRAIASLYASPAIIGLSAPFTFPFGSNSDSLWVMRLRPRASGYVTVELVYGQPEETDPLVNMEESIPCIAHL
jgi:hypothetical protein